MTLLFDLGLIICGAILLLVGADWFLDGVRDLARLMGLSALVLGILLVGLEPEEMLTAALASGRGLPALAVNNVLGTNITIVTCALGLSAFLTPIALSKTIRRQALLATLISLVPIVLLLTGFISRVEGVLLLLCFAAYTFILLRTDRALFKEAVRDDDDDDEPYEKITHPAGKMGRLFALTLLGLVTMGGGGWLLVEGAERFVMNTGLGAGLVGGTIISLATSAEMIGLGITAARRKESAVLVGGILGSFAYNLLVTLGVAASVHPLPVDFRQTLVPLLFMLISHLALVILIWRGYIARLAGSLFFATYLLYICLAFVIR